MNRGSIKQRGRDDALSKAIDKGLQQQRRQQQQIIKKGVVARRRRNVGGGTVVAPSSSTTMMITPSMRDYRTYCHIIALSFGASAPEVTFPSFVNDEDNDWKIYKSIVERIDTGGGTDDPRRSSSFFDDSFLRALKSVFKSVTFAGNNNLNKLRNQIVGHAQGSGVYRKWSDWYQRSTELGLFGDRGTPIVISLSFYPAAAMKKTTFAKFMRETDLRPVLLNNIGHILFQSERSSTNDPRVNSLQARDLKRLCAKSVYYRRAYIVHLMIYMVAYEALRCSSGNNKHVVMVAEPALRPLLRLPTLWSVAIHSEPDIDLYYMG